MFELAFDQDGDPIEVPSAAVSWRVRKLPVRGRPQVVYGSDGLPLIVPIGATLAEFRSAVQLEGRYRLDPVDELRREVAGARAAYVRLAPPAGAAVVARAATAARSARTRRRPRSARTSIWQRPSWIRWCSCWAWPVASSVLPRMPVRRPSQIPLL